MQVLGWQCRMIRKHALELENIDLGEETPDLELSSSLIGGPSLPSVTGNFSPDDFEMDPASIVLAGFRDCSEEAIRYLIDVEQISEDDPLILGLKQHLWERQQHLDIERIMSESMSWSDITCGVDAQQSHPNTSVNRTEHSEHYQQTRIHLQHPTSNSGEDTLASSSETSGSASSTSDVQMDESSDLNVSADSSETSLNDSVSLQMTDSTFSSSSPVVSHGSHPLFQSVRTEQASTDVNLSQSVLNLAMLAQNNPAIASLTDEILSLLQEEDHHDSDFDSDLDFEESDDQKE